MSCPIALNRAIGMNKEASIPQDLLSLVTEGSSGKQAANISLLCRFALPAPGSMNLSRSMGFVTGEGEWPVAIRTAMAAASSRVRAERQRAFSSKISFLSPKKHVTTGLGQRRILGRIRASVLRPRRFGKDGDHLSARDRIQEPPWPKKGDPSDLVGEVAATDAHGMRDSRAGVVYEGCKLLNPGARSTDHTDRTAANDVGKADALSCDQCRTAIRPHDDEAALSGGLLQGAFVFDGDIVTEEKDVQTVLKGPPGFP